MRKLFTLLCLLYLGLQAVNAQCSGCTSSITGLSSANYVVSTGQKLCISATGTVTGLISVSGGTLCNQGNIQTSKVLISGGGKFDNSGTAGIDSLMVTGMGSVLTNYGSMTHVRMTTAVNATTFNYGNVIIDYIGDTIGNYYNTGNLTINKDVYHGYSSTFANTGFMSIGRDFYNSASSAFYTNCMITVGRDWYNAATVSGYSSGTTCGGFKITGGSYNSGTINTTSGPMDICDQGNPTHIDANSGTITSGVTYCSCVHACAIAATGINDLQKQEEVVMYPNPANNILYLRYNTVPDVIEIYNTMGMLLLTEKNETQSETSLNTELLAKGIYFISAKSKGRVIFSSKFIKE